MATYQLKPGPTIEADPYQQGMEDGFISFTSDTLDVNPIPAALDLFAHFYTQVIDQDDWLVSIPYVGDSIPVLPDDYVITRTDNTKYVMRKAAFEAMYEPAYIGLP